MTTAFSNFLMSPKGNFGAGGFARRLIDITRVYSDESIVWQEIVYDEARLVADRFGMQCVVDIGIGGGYKLVDKFKGFEAEYLQVDWADNRKPSGNSNSVRFLQANLEDAPDLDALFTQFSAEKSSLIILADVIEHLVDPRPLLRVIRAVLKLNPSNRLIISTPDRDRMDGKGSISVPDNPTHVRQWTLTEFGEMLKASGFFINSLTRGPQNKFDTLDRTIIAEVSCSPAHYKNFLKKAGLPASSDHMVITTENSKALVTGGIGTYYQICEEHSGHSRLTLYCGGAGLPENWVDFVRESGWTHCSALCGRAHSSLQEIGNLDFHEILDAVLSCIFLYDELRLIEYQDYLGIGVHVAQAKRARMIPASIYVIAYAHGTHFYLDHAAGDVSEKRELAVDVRERLSIELADCVVFPSKFLERMYIDIYALKPRRTVFQPYPISLSDDVLPQNDFEKISTLVFYGKHTHQKGYFDFCDAVLRLYKDAKYKSSISQLKRIVVLGSKAPDPRLFEIPGVEIEFGVFSRTAVVERIRQLAPNSLMVMPYKGDNHPLSTFELVDANCQLLAYEAGGLPEQIPAELHNLMLCKPDAASLADAMHRCITMQFWERCELIKNAKASIKWSYINHGNSYLRLFESFKLSAPVFNSVNEDVSVIVPNYNGKSQWLNDAILGLKNSFKKPVEVIFVDDASSAENFSLLKEMVESIDEFDARLIRNETNRGLAGTRNVGLKMVRTKYVCAHDNDNVLLNRYLDTACRILDENPEVAAVTSWLIGFNDGEGWELPEATSPSYTWRPLGSDVGLGLRENTFGDALAVYRVDALNEVGGWDESSKALWEDWQLFLKLAAAGKQIWVVPNDMFLYRIRPNSMLRTYSKFGGWMRIANVISGIPENHKFGFIRSAITPTVAALRENSTLQWEKSCLQAEVDKGREKIEFQFSEIERLAIYEAEVDKSREKIEFQFSEIERLAIYESRFKDIKSSRSYWLTKHYYALYDIKATGWVMRPMRRMAAQFRRIFKR